MFVIALGTICRRLKPRGRGRLAAFLSRHPREVAYRDLLGFRRTSNLADLVEARWFLGLPPIDLSVVQDWVNTGDWVVDLGAHAGIVTSILAGAVGPTGRVWAVEPIPANVAKLRRLVEENHLEQVSLFECAISCKVGEAIIHSGPEEGSPYGSLTASWVGGSGLSVKTETLDSLVGNLPGRISFIKVDIEGAELALLDGAMSVLSASRPVVLCEFNDVVLKDAGASSRQLLERFRELGYLPDPALDHDASILDGACLDLTLHPKYFPGPV